MGGVLRTEQQEPRGQSVDCDVCIAKAGEACYLQTSADEHRRSGSVYYRGTREKTFTGKEAFHVGIRLTALPTKPTKAER